MYLSRVITPLLKLPSLFICSSGGSFLPLLHMLPQSQGTETLPCNYPCADFHSWRHERCLCQVPRAPQRRQPGCSTSGWCLESGDGAGSAVLGRTELQAPAKPPRDSGTSGDAAHAGGDPRSFLQRRKPWGSAGLPIPPPGWQHRHRPVLPGRQLNSESVTGSAQTRQIHTSTEELPRQRRNPRLAQRWMLIALGTARTQVHVSQECLGPCPDTSVPSLPRVGIFGHRPRRRPRVPRQRETLRARSLPAPAAGPCSANAEPPEKSG